MRALLVEWDAVGPTFKEKWEEIKTDFYGTYHELNDKIKTHYKQIREEQKENLNKKRALIEKVKTLLSEDLKTNKQWQSASNIIKELQEEWKKIGFVPAAYNQKIWNEFRSAGNELFAKKKEFFGEVKEQQKEITKVKKDLITKAEQLVVSVKKDAKEDWANATKNIISLQREWKNAGSAIRQDEQKLWSKFRKTCDDFFEVKDQQNKSQRDAEGQNLKLKDEVITELKSYKAGKTQEDSLKSIDELTVKYNAVGFIPFKQKEKQEKAFEKAVESAYKVAGVSKEQKEELLFSQRVEQLKSGKNSLKSLEYERISVRQDINKAKDEELKLANNLGFFSGSDSNPLIKKAKADHAVTVYKREGLEGRMKQLNIEINAAKKAEEAEKVAVIEEVEGEK
jgi:peptidase E